MKSIDEFSEVVNNAIAKSKAKHSKNRIIVGYGTCGIAAGAEEVYNKLNEVIKDLNLENDVIVEKTGCIGCCSYEPLLDIELAGEPRVSYSKVQAKDVEKLIKNHFEGKIDSDKVLFVFHKEPNLLLPSEEWQYNVSEKYKEFFSFENHPMLKKQLRVTLRDIGLINPESIDDYLARGGYQALIKAITSLTPNKVIEIVKTSKFRGRGGAGFPTARKWEFAANVKSDIKYVVANADEGDPGAFMDRALIEGDPHALIEGLSIAGYAIGASKGFIYIRAEYPLAVERLEKALVQAKEYGLLGENILGTEFSFDIEIRKGAGAFVCGEETALLNSIMGLRGEPRTRPPYPAIKGLWDKPTTINNVKTLSTLPVIIMKDGKWCPEIGTEDTSGTAVFALTGDINRSGLAEVPMGTTVRDVVFEIGGGVKNNKKLKAVQTGGPSGGCIPESLIDTPIDFASLKKLGSIMGSGGMIVINEDTCIVDLAKYFLNFTSSESCGKCTPCREGLVRALEILEKITEGKGTMEDLEKLEELSIFIKDTALCGLGQTAPNPILSTIKYFREEYIEHIEDKKCRAHVCKGLYKYEINDSKCIKCGICHSVCPVSAVLGNKDSGFYIEPRLCISCNMCFERCPEGAIEKVDP